MRYGAAAAAALMLAAPATAERSSLVGHWTGTIQESRGPIVQYTLSVHIDTDLGGRPVGVVEYDAFPCTGVWNNHVRAGAAWRFSETIVEGGTRCARHVVVELTPAANGLRVRLWPAGSPRAVSTGLLHRRGR